jgi:hypothetical protein
MERKKGLEPSTFCMASRRSSQLSYFRKKKKNGAREEARTLDDQIGNLALYQLSYSCITVNTNILTNVSQLLLTTKL